MEYRSVGRLGHLLPTTLITDLRLANNLRCGAAPAITYNMPSEEQQKVLKEIQKEQAATMKTEPTGNRQHPHEGGTSPSGIFRGECRVCGIQGQRDASMQYQQQFAMSGGFSGQQMQPMHSMEMEHRPTWLQWLDTRVPAAPRKADSRVGWQANRWRRPADLAITTRLL